MRQGARPDIPSGPMVDLPPPELFVARDRARRFARYIREALQERRLHYRGADVGMASLLDEADAALAAVLEDAHGTIEAILGGRIRDRERAYMEMPLVVATEGLIDRVDLARRMDKARTLGGFPERDARAAVLALLDDALLRLDAYCGAYDEKRPIGPRRDTDLGHVLEQVERHAAWEHALSSARVDAGPAYDVAPPTLRSDPNGLEDLLRALRAAAPDLGGAWHVEPGGPGRALTLELGTPSDGAEEVLPPERVVRALEILTFVHPVAVLCMGRPAEGAGVLSPQPSPNDGLGESVIESITIELPDEAAGTVELSVAAAGGSEAHLAPEDEKAVRALLSAPPLPEMGPPPPARLVALMGVLQALDRALAKRVLPLAQTNGVRVAASRLPRETTRKAPLLRGVTAQLEQRFRGFPSHRVEEISAAASDGKLANRHANASDIAVLLALFGRRWNAGGRDIERMVDLPPLTDEDVEELVRELTTIAAVRKQLESGKLPEAVRMTRLERACVAVLGQLGRIA